MTPDDRTRALRCARVAVTATFTVHAVIAGTLGPWIPRLKSDNGLDASELGLALTGFAVGLVAGTRLASPAIRAAGGRAVVRVGVPMLAGGLALLPVANGLGALIVLFVVFGAAGGLLDVAMNAESVAVEERFGRPVLSVLHGTWSVSVLAGAAIASAGLAAGIGIGIHLPAVAGVLVVGSYPLLRWLPAPHEAPRDLDPTDAGGDPSARVVLLCLVAAASFLAEGAALEWSAVLLREGLGADAGTAGLGVVAFSAGMATARFIGDRVAARIGSAVLVRGGAAVATVALGLAIVLGDVATWIAAFALLGLGLGPVIPLAFRAAGGLRLAAARTALAVVVTAGYVGSIVGPMVMGFTADAFGLRDAFAIPVLACLAIAISGASIADGRSRRLRAERPA
jgi:fucose permease